MAISKILHINPHMNSETYHLKTGLNYITKSEKTINGLYVGAVNCMVENAYECMRTTKEIYGKTDKRQAYHLIISFEEIIMRLFIQYIMIPTTFMVTSSGTA